MPDPGSLQEGFGSIRREFHSSNEPAQIGARELQEQVTNRRRVQDTGIVNRRDICHWVLQSVAHVQFLGLAGQFVQRNHLLPVISMLVGKKLTQENAPVCAYPTMSDRSPIQQLDQIGS